VGGAISTGGNGSLLMALVRSCRLCYKLATSGAGASSQPHVGSEIASVLVGEVFYPRFANRRQLASFVG
jgi:hypothetical protein